MNVVIIIALVYMAILCGVTALRLIACSRQERWKRLKSFKCGKFVLIYVAVYPLYFLAQRFNGMGVDAAFWLSFHSCVKVAVMDFDYATVAPLMAESQLFFVAIEVLFALVLCNALLFVLSFCGQWLYNRISLLQVKCAKHTVAVVGTNGNALSVLSTVPEGHRAILLGELTPELKDEAYLRRAACRNLTDGDDLKEVFKKVFGNCKKRKVSMILALGDDERSLRRVKELCALIEEEKLTEVPLTGDVGLTVFVFAASANEGLFAHYTERSKGVIRFINRHKLIAADFIDRYPLTQFMTEQEIDFQTATLRDPVQPNVVMVGFGKVNEKLFLASVSNNQFLTIREGKLCPKPVTYHIFDRQYPEGKFTAQNEVHSFNLHHGYTRYMTFLEGIKGKEKEYFELPALPAQTKKYAREVSHPAFYKEIREIVLPEHSYTYIVISFGSDLENIELAEKLRQKIVEWDVRSTVKIFVKVRDEKTTRCLTGEMENVIFFGSNSGCVYNAKVILREKLDRMARLRHLLYAAEDKVKGAGHSDPNALNDLAIREEARKKWYGFREFQRESNVYACLGLRVKLQLCGFDYAEKGADQTKAFLQLYEQGDARTPSSLEVAGKRIWSYSNAEQFRPSVRWRLAVQEHQRWCANMIASGLIPCSKRELLTLSKGDLLEKRKHGNLTTMEGLVEYREFVADAKGKSEEETDVIRYDYQLMDDVDRLLPACGYTLIKHE